MSRLLDQLAALSREISASDRRCSVNGEGNTAARIDDDSFFVKATGTTLCSATPDSFVPVSRSRALKMLDAGELDYRQTRLGLEDAKVDPEIPALPSRETLLHAVCMDVPGVQWVVRVHPTSVNALTCSRQFSDLATLRLTPDEVAICGRESLLIPYTSPGVELARAVRAGLSAFVGKHGTHPNLVLVQNNGMIALADHADHALAITVLATETAKTLAATQAFGGPRPLTDEELDQITSRNEALGRPSTKNVGHNWE